MTRPGIVGILGGGQLGRMLSLAAARLGVRTRCMDRARDAVAGDVCELIVDQLEDPHHLDEFLDGVSAVTYEFENVPVELAERIVAMGVPVHPSPLALRTSQDRLLEKHLFRSLSIGTPAFEAVDALDDLRAAVARIGLPVVVKTRRFGYDGKGQAVIRAAGEIEPAFALLQRGVPGAGSSNLGPVPLIVESMVPFDREVSILAVRSAKGETAVYPLVENRHEGGILRVSRAGGEERGAPAHAAESHAFAQRVLDALHYVGVIAIEMFDMGGRLLANEIAPRVHNSGHWTMDGAATCQFENHIRAVLGLPLGECTMRTGAPLAGMVNLIGDHPPLAMLLRIPGARVHLYGKRARPGRKLGHVNVSGVTREERDAMISRVEEAIRGTQV